MISSIKEEEIIIGNEMTLDMFMDVVRKNRKIEFSSEFKERVGESRKLVEKWVIEGRRMYGITTGFGANSTSAISKEDAEQLQKNIIITHATSVGKAMSREEVRASILMILLNAGSGYTGVRLETLERYKEFLNKDLLPFVPKEGSVGYLSPEAHIALAVMGEGKMIWEG